MNKEQIAKEYKSLLTELEKVGTYFKKLDRAFYRVLSETPDDEIKLEKIKDEYDKISAKLDTLSNHLTRLKDQL